MRTIIIDGNNTLWRIARMMPMLTAPEGNRVEVVYGFLRIVRSSLEMFEPDSCLVAWDEGEPRIRIDIFEGYKKKRREKKDSRYKTPEEQREFHNVMAQLAVIKRTLSYLCVAQMWMKDTEADDIIANATRALPGRKIIVSADHDMLQLVNKDTSVYFPLSKKPEHFKLKNFEKKVGLTPRQFVECKAMTGDGSDEIPGIAKGFGKKSAMELLNKYGSAERIWKKCKEVEGMAGRYAKAVTEDAKETYHRNMRLVDLSLTHSDTLCRMIRHELKTHRKLDKIKVREYFRSQSFVSLLKDFIVWLKPFEALRRRR